MRMDKITLITGANRGLGFEFVKQLFSKGHRIVATARSTQDSHELIDFVKKNPNQIEFHELDVSLPESIANLTNLLKTLPPGEQEPLHPSKNAANLSFPSSIS
jgi:NAD(P)-dependent dehydrogenase (short-subunit alcohol dehydrogenase family)